MSRCLALGLLLATMAASDGPGLSLAIGHDPGPPQALVDPAWQEAAALILDWSRQDEARAWLVATLTTSDGRSFRTLDELHLAPGRGHGSFRLALDGSTWGGAHGPLDADARRGGWALTARVVGGAETSLVILRARPQVPPTATRPPAWTVLPEPHTVERGPWQEWRFRLAGPPLTDADRVVVEDQQGRRLPCFVDLPGALVDGRWIPRGPTRHTIRHGPDELPGPRRVVVETATGDRWVSAWFRPGAVAADPLPPAPAGAYPVPAVAPVIGEHTWFESDGPIRRHGRLDAAIAPVISWDAAWTGFRGPHAVGHFQVRAVDARLARGCAAIDLLPQALATEQGTFRAGLAPWRERLGAAHDLLADGPTLAALETHALAVVARARATPGLRHWRLGLVEPGSGPAMRRTWRAFVERLAAQIAALDDRPLVVLHPDLVPYRQKDRSPWFTFAGGPEGWQGLGLGHGRHGAFRYAMEGADGRGSLALDFPGTVGSAGTLSLACDANLFPYERIEFDGRLAGGGHVSVFAFCTDQHHRWYQREVAAWLPADGRWRTLALPLHDRAAWQPFLHQHGWDGSQRRRIRRLGLLVVHHPEATGTSRAATFSVDRLRRFGWPQEERPEPAVVIRPLTGPVPAWQRVEGVFAVRPSVANPYDPDQADCRLELRRPDGSALRHPAFWYEPFVIERVADEERIRPDGRGQWRWRWTFDQPGTWQWRVAATIADRGQRHELASPWQELEVTPAATSALVPVRPSANDPRWFETVTGAFFYPVGINLRSPSESLDQSLCNRVMIHTRDGAVGRKPAAKTLAAERLGTFAYDHFFSRLAAVGGNFARVWMAPWWTGLEWSSTFDDRFHGLGVYEQAHAARLDRLFALAREHRIHLQVELNNHGMYAERVDQEWEHNPYNQATGGMCRTAAEFFASELAWQTYEKRLRYTIARWGAEPNLFAWVLCSEMEFTGSWWDRAMNQGERGHDPVTAAWVSRHFDWLAANDATGRPATIHFSHPWRGGRLWREESRLAFSYSNIYTGFQTEMGQLGGPQAGLASAHHRYLGRYFPPWDLERPTLVGEWGGHWSTNTDDKLRAELRTGTWLQAALPFGGNTGFWWWLWLDDRDLWQRLEGPGRFAAASDPRGQDLRPYRPSVEAGEAKAYVLGSRGRDLHRYYAWLAGLDRTLDKRDDRDAGHAVIDTGAPDTTWLVERWSCSEGRVAARLQLRTDRKGRLLLPLGSLQPDAAFRLVRTEPAGATANPRPTP